MTHQVTVSFDPTAPATRDAHLSAAAADGETTFTRILGTALPIGAPSNPASDGYRYQFAELPENHADPVDVVNEHDSWADPIGRLESLTLDPDTQLVAATARIFDTQAGRDALVLAAEGVKGGWSVGASFQSYTEDDDGVRHVTGPWRARHLGLVRRPAFTESRGLTLAASAAPNPEEGTPPMTHTNTDTAAAAGSGVQVVELPTIAELAAQVKAELDSQQAKPSSPLAQFATAEAFFAAFAEGQESDRVRLSAAFALGSQVTADNPGVILPTWYQDIKANLDRRRPVVQAFGGPGGLPDSGMDTSWPYFDGDLDALVAQQAAQLAQLTGVKISIKRATANILTAGVASEVAWQLVLRGSPSYMAAHNAITTAAWYRFTEAVFEAAIGAASVELGTGSTLPAIAAGAKPTAFNGKIFDASMAVEDATGAPAEFVLCSDSIFKELGAADLPNPENSNGGGTPNATGTASASKLRVNINGLEHIRAPFLTGDQVIVSNQTAAKFTESGAQVATADQITKLGTEVATWGMYVPAEVYLPAGIVRLDRTV